MDQVRLGATGLEDAIAAADVSLSDAEIARVEEPHVAHPVLGHG
jgi:hypothetical protein